MPFTPKPFMRDIRAFIADIAVDMYPQDIPVDVRVDYQMIDPDGAMSPQGIAVAQVGLDTPNRSIDVLGGIVITRQANFMVIIRRQMAENDWRRETGDFLQNMANRIEYENALRGTPEEHPLLPHFSETRNEEIRCTGGMETMNEVEPGIVENALNVMLIYDLVFERPY